MERLLQHRGRLQKATQLLLRPWKLLVLSMYLLITLAFFVSINALRWERLELTPLGDKSFKNMSDQDWDLVIAVHLKGAYSCTKACWPLFRQQKVSYNHLKVLKENDLFRKKSLAGSWTQRQQLACMAIWAKQTILRLKVRYQSVSVNLFLMTITIVGLIGFTRTLAREGTKYDIKANVIAPVSNHQTYTLILIFP